MREKNAILLNNNQKEILQKNLWIEGKLNRKIIAKSAKFIAKELKIDVRQPFEPIGTGNTAIDADKFYESDYKLNSDEIQLG